VNVATRLTKPTPRLQNPSLFPLRFSTPHRATRRVEFFNRPDRLVKLTKGQLGDVPHHSVRTARDPRLLFWYHPPRRSRGHLEPSPHPTYRKQTPRTIRNRLCANHRRALELILTPAAVQSALEDPIRNAMAHRPSGTANRI
jgi:hypothetical protein